MLAEGIQIMSRMKCFDKMIDHRGFVEMTEMEEQRAPLSGRDSHGWVEEVSREPRKLFPCRPRQATIIILAVASITEMLVARISPPN
jgi:hypothetical protein